MEEAGWIRAEWINKAMGGRVRIDDLTSLARNIRHRACQCVYLSTEQFERFGALLPA